MDFNTKADPRGGDTDQIFGDTRFPETRTFPRGLRSTRRAATPYEALAPSPYAASFLGDAARPLGLLEQATCDRLDRPGGARAR